MSDAGAMEEARGLRQAALQLQERGETTEAFRLLRQALFLLERNGARQQPEVADVLLGLAENARSRYGSVETEIYARQAVSVLQQSGTPVRLKALGLLGNALIELGRFQEAERVILDAILENEQNSGDPAAIADAWNLLGTLYKTTGRYAEAEPVYLRALALVEPRGPAAVAIYHNLATSAQAAGRYAEGVEPARMAFELRRELAGDDSVDAALEAEVYAALLEGADRCEEARDLYLYSLGVFERTLGPDHYEIAVTLSSLAGLEQNLGNAAESERLYRKALAMKRAVLPAGHPATARTAHSLALLLEDMGRDEEAGQLMVSTLGSFLQPLAEDTSNTRTPACVH